MTVDALLRPARRVSFSYVGSSACKGCSILHSIYTVMLCFCLGEQVSDVEAPVLACDPVCQQFIILFFHFYPRIKPARAGETRGNSCNYLVILDLGS